MPKASSIGIARVRKIQNVKVAAHEVARSCGDREIEVWLVLGVSLVKEHMRHFRREYGSLF